MTQLRAADDIQKDDWVVTPDGDDIGRVSGIVGADHFYRILEPGDEVPASLGTLR